MSSSSLLSLPNDLLVYLPEHFERIEDAVSLSQTCRKLRKSVEAMSSKALLRLAAEPTNVLFRMPPDVLLAVVGRQLGNWARLSGSNENVFASQAQSGVEGLLELAMQHCGLTLERLWEFHRRRIEFLEPLANVIDQCVGEQWYEPEFWDGGRDGASSVSLHPRLTVYHFVMYGEIFGPDFEAYVSSEGEAYPRRLSLQTRLEVVKYCIPDMWLYYAVEGGRMDGVDPRLSIQDTGPYTLDDEHEFSGNNNISLVWTLQSPHWRRYWKDMRARAGIVDFADTADEAKWDEDPAQWRQSLLESAMMLVPLNGQWTERCKKWREAIARMETQPELTWIEEGATCDFPYLLGDLQMIGHPWFGSLYNMTAQRDRAYPLLPPWA